MNGTQRYLPSRRSGLILHAVLIILLSLAAGVLIYFAFQFPAGGVLVLFLILGFLLLVPLFILIYRVYALLNASYELERDGLRVRWGLRVEEIPLPEIEWMRPIQELGEELQHPFLSTPGALIGSVISPNLGVIEFMASEWKTLVIVATTQKIFAISPDEPGDFVQAFQRTAEMGSLTPLEPYSAQPAAFLIRVWRDRLARLLLSLLTALTLLLLVLDSLLVMSRTTLSLGFSPARIPLEAGPSSNLLLLPVLMIFGWIADFLGGLFLYQREHYRLAAYAVWIAGSLTAVLLIVASLILVLFT